MNLFIGVGLDISLRGFLGEFRHSCNIGWHAGTTRASMPAYIAGASELTKETSMRNAEAYIGGMITFLVLLY